MINKKTIVFLLHVSALCLGLIRDDYEHYPELEGWLKVHPERVDWKKARDNCHSEGALLAGPWTDQFKTTISKLQSTLYPSLPVLYSGAGLRTGSAGLPMEPCKNKRCRVFLANGSMSQVSCNQRLPYICYVPTPTCGGDGYAFEKRTGECYKFHTVEANWSKLKKICLSEGAKVAKINSPEEESVLQEMSDGLTFINNDDGGPALRHLFKSYREDYSCDESHTYICEKSPKSKSDFRD